MQIKHIRWIAVIGLLAITELQYVWLVNTYKLTKESIQMKSDELFGEAAFQEAFSRLKAFGKTLPEDSVGSVQLSFGEDPDTLSIEDLSEDALVGQWLVSHIHIALQEKLADDYHIPVSLVDLDSIYTHLLDSVGIQAQIMSCVIDSAGNVIQSSGQKEFGGKGIFRTDPVPINFSGTCFLQGVITNPYWVIFQRMTLLLIATVLIMGLVVACIVYQIRIIIRQDKIARLREDFSYAMIHDMKTPLSSIIMGAQILETGKLDVQPEKKARYFRILKEEGEHLLSLTNKVLTLSKLENHQLKLMKTPCELRPMLEDLAEKYRVKAGKAVTYEWRLEQATVQADEEFLKEALSNLIDNALKYSDEAVEIVFTSGRNRNGMAYVSVRDNGFGIPLKDQSKIFEKYERALAATRSRDGGAVGFGLGLNYVLRVAEAHGGSVSVESVEGEYSIFTIYLPEDERETEGRGEIQNGMPLQK